MPKLTIEQMADTLNMLIGQFIINAIIEREIPPSQLYHMENEELLQFCTDYYTRSCARLTRVLGVTERNP